MGKNKDITIISELPLTFHYLIGSVISFPLDIVVRIDDLGKVRLFDLSNNFRNQFENIFGEYKTNKTQQIHMFCFLSLTLAAPEGAASLAEDATAVVVLDDAAVAAAAAAAATAPLPGMAITCCQGSLRGASGMLVMSRCRTRMLF